MPSHVAPESAAQWQQWHDVLRADASIENELVHLFEDLTCAIAARGPTCWTSGKCCNFNAYGHRLYVTGLEITWLLLQLRSSPHDKSARDHDADLAPLKSELSLPTLTGEKPEQSRNRKIEIRNLRPDAIDLTAPCIFQQNNLCTVHAIRPLGCRVFFCQQGTQDWQHALYEDFQQRLRSLHERRGLPYRYLEWRAGLQEALSVLTPNANA